MASDMCPYCNSMNTESEVRLKAPKSNASVGQWRVGCGYTMVAVVALIGATAVLLRALWLSGDLGRPVMYIALFAFLFAALLLIMTVRFARWRPMRRHTCLDCTRTWLSELTPDEQPVAPESGSQVRA
jgi:membrane protein YdbS with pleckstrin-like domain